MKPKVISYAELVSERKRCMACANLTNPSKYEARDSDHIGPYSRWQGNLDAELLVVGQDYADVETYLVGEDDWPGESVRTNLTLVELVQEAGIKISAPRRGYPDDRLFFTNAILCLKPANPHKRSSMQGNVPREYFRNCGEWFLRRTIELVQPRAVVTLGRPALDATLYAFGLGDYNGTLLALVESGRTFNLSCGARLFPMYHPSPTVLNTRRSLEEQKADWRRLGLWLRTD
jgi:uracil-DNA glycosylase